MIDLVLYDNSCSDPDCCAGPMPNMVYVKFDNGEYDSFADGFAVDGRSTQQWLELDLIGL